ncbi:MAG: histidinol-phosphate transaminase, partial [bacterium]
LASNENPRGPSPKAVEAINRALREIHLYPDAGGYALGQRLSQEFDFPADSIVLGNGSVEIIEIICEAFLEPGWESITGPQAFLKYRIASQIMGVRPIMVPMPDFRYDGEAMVRAITPKTKLVFIANPNNPTGTYLDRTQVERILGSLPDQGILVLDEAYFEYMDKPDYPNGLDYVKAGERVIVLRTFSKAYGLAGVRCGYAFAPPEIAVAMQKVREPFNCSSLAQVAALAALDDQDFVQESLQLNRLGMAEVVSGLKEFPVDVIPSVTNFVLVDFRRPFKPLFTELLKRGVIIRPMEPYDLPTCARISIGLSHEHKKLIMALREVLS